MQVAHVLRNPNYTDIYFYLRHRVWAADETRARQVTLRPLSEMLKCPRHHDGYITWEEFEENQTQLKANRAKRRGPIGNGAALCQGILWCGRCSRWIRTVDFRHRKSGHALASYRCHPADRIGRVRQCFSVGSSILDGVIERAVLACITPGGIEAALRAIDDTVAQKEAANKAQARLLQRAGDAVNEARRRYEQVDPSHPMVKADLEARFEEACQAKKELERRLGRARRTEADSIGEADAAELVERAADVRTLWRAATTTNQDRKELIGTVISRVVVRAKTEESVEFDIEWVSGLRETHQAHRRKGLEKIVVELIQAGHMTMDAILRELRSRDVLNAFGRPIQRQLLWKILNRHGLGRKANWIRGLLRIRELVLEGFSTLEILARLREEGPPHWLGEWTLRRVRGAIDQIRLGTVPPEVQALPQHIKIKPSVRTAPAVADAMRNGRAAGRSWQAIVAEINASGWRSATGSPLTVEMARALAWKWKHAGAVK